MGDNGKGHNRRPRLVSRETFDNNWANTFGKKKQECTTKSGCCCDTCGPCEECKQNESVGSTVSESGHTSGADLCLSNATAHQTSAGQDGSLPTEETKDKACEIKPYDTLDDR